MKGKEIKRKNVEKKNRKENKHENTYNFSFVQLGTRFVQKISLNY